MITDVDPSGFVTVVVTVRPGDWLAPLPMTPSVLLPLIPQLRPIWLSADRFTSAKRTSSMTCCDGAERKQVDDLARRIGLGDLHRAVGLDRVAAPCLRGRPSRSTCSRKSRSPGRRPESWRLSVVTSGPTTTSTTAIRWSTVVERQAGRPGLLAEHVDRPVADRDDVGDVGIADQRLGVRPVGMEHLALVDRHVELARADVRRDADLGQRRMRGEQRPDCRRAKRKRVSSF